MEENKKAASDLSASTKPQLNLSTAISICTAYAIAVGMAYLWGFWHSFGIRILDYMTFADVLAASAWPLFGVIGGLLVGMLLGGQQAQKNGGDRDNWFGRSLRWYWKNLRDLHYFGLFLIWVLDVPNKWHLLGFFGGVPLSVYIIRQPWMDAFPIPYLPKLMITLLVVFVPPSAITNGQNEAESILNGVRYQAVYSDIPGFTVSPDAKADLRLRFIGQRGDTIFLWAPQERRTVVTKFSSDRSLVLGRNDTGNPTTAWQAIVGWAATRFK